jgi:7-carboxy-7-deazaguanine synthase
MSLAISEVFGPTIQGEGPYTGRRVAFIRLGACNLTCSWCDTPYTWDADRYDLKKEIKPAEVEDIVSLIADMKVNVVIISGGEPLLQQKRDDWRELLEVLTSMGISIHIETNGTIVPNETSDEYIDHFSVSPKLSCSGVPVDKRLVGAALTWFAQDDRSIFKFVIDKVADIEDEVDVLVDALAIKPETVWLMPEGATLPDHLNNLQELADDIVKSGYNLSARVHIFAWNTKRGV